MSADKREEVVELVRQYLAADHQHDLAAEKLVEAEEELDQVAKLLGKAVRAWLWEGGVRTRLADPVHVHVGRYAVMVCDGKAVEVAEGGGRDGEAGASHSGEG